MSATSTALLVVGVLLALAGVAFLALDALHMGDSSGIDPKDVGILVVGILLAVIGAALAGRKKVSVPPA